jgi:hypothetical protein
MLKEQQEAPRQVAAEELGRCQAWSRLGSTHLQGGSAAAQGDEMSEERCCELQVETSNERGDDSHAAAESQLGHVSLIGKPKHHPNSQLLTLTSYSATCTLPPELGLIRDVSSPVAHSAGPAVQRK